MATTNESSVDASDEQKEKMPNKVTLYPIFAVADAIDGQPFDPRILPFQISAGVAVEDVKPLFTPDTFKWVEGEVGRNSVTNLQRIEYAVVQRIDRYGLAGRDVVTWSPVFVTGHTIEVLLDDLLPSRQSIASAHGKIMADSRMEQRPSLLNCLQ